VSGRTALLRSSGGGPAARWSTAVMSGDSGSVCAYLVPVPVPVPVPDLGPGLEGGDVMLSWWCGLEEVELKVSWPRPV